MNTQIKVVLDSIGPKKVSGLFWLDWYVWGKYNGVPIDASNEDMYAYYIYCV